MSVAAAADVRSRNRNPGTLYYQLRCHWCDQPTEGDHLDFCRDGQSVNWDKLRTFVFMRDRWPCRYCNWMPADVSELRWLHADHVRPRSTGGRDVPWNLVTACWECNGRKGASIVGWLGSWEADRADYEAAVEDAYAAETGAYA